MTSSRALAASVIALRAANPSAVITTSINYDKGTAELAITGLGVDRSGAACAMQHSDGDINYAIEQALVNVLLMAGFPVMDDNEPASHEQLMDAYAAGPGPKPVEVEETPDVVQDLTPAPAKRTTTADELYAPDPTLPHIIDRDGVIMGPRALASQVAAVFQMAGQLLSMTKDDVVAWVQQEHGGRSPSDLTRKEATMFVEAIKAEEKSRAKKGGV